MSNTYTVVEHQSLHLVIVSEDGTSYAGITDFCLSFEQAIRQVSFYMRHPYASKEGWHPNIATMLIFNQKESARVAREARHANAQQLSPNPSPSLAPALRLPYQNKAGQTNIYIGDQAWDWLTTQRDRYGYGGRSATTGMTHYIEALLEANPDLDEHWSDERPEHLTMYDEYRLKNNKFKVWVDIDAIFSADDWRVKRSINADHFERLLPKLNELANRFFIAPLRGDQLSPKNRAAAVLEAIGARFLLPKFDPRPNQKPIDRQRHAQYVSRAAQAKQSLNY